MTIACRYPVMALVQAVALVEIEAKAASCA